MPLSLWLLPPADDGAVLAERMRAVGRQHGLPSAAPHITLLSTIVDAREDDRAMRDMVLQRLAALGERWDGGVVLCEFTEIHGNEAWNQSGVAIVRESPQIRALQ